MKIILATILLSISLFLAAPSFAGVNLIGEMQKLIVFEQEMLMPELIMDGLDDKQYFLSDYAGQVVLVNLWATWCPPCVEELSSLDALQAEMGGEDFKVIAISMDDKMTPEEIQTFLTEKGVENLDVYIDHEGSTTHIPELFGLPTSYIINDVGNMVARYEGDADWGAPESQAVIQHFIDEFREKFGRDPVEEAL